jgi:outer membrane immunogenic protein
MKNNTKKITSAFLSLAFVALIGSSAVAQSTDTDWTGFYVGGHAGVSVGRPSVNTSTVYNDSGYFAQTSVPVVNAAGAQRIKANGFNGGAQGGYNKQFGRIVIGAEADFGSHSLNESVVSGAVYPCCSPDSFTISQEVKSRWLMTARPRVGVTAGKAMFYATGGLAVGDVEYNAVFEDNDSDALETASFKETRAGYAAGGGVEFKLSKRWSAKGEYLFVDLGRATETSNNLTTTFFGGKEVVLGGGGIEEWPSSVFTHSARVKTHNIRFGVNYHF